METQRKDVKNLLYSRRLLMMTSIDHLGSPENLSKNLATGGEGKTPHCYILQAGGGAQFEVLPHVPLSSSSITWYWSKCSDALCLGLAESNGSQSM